MPFYITRGFISWKKAIGFSDNKCILTSCESLKKPTVCKGYHALQCSETGNLNAGKADRSMSVDEITILRLAGEESSIVGHCTQFYNSTVL